MGLSESDLALKLCQDLLKILRSANPMEMPSKHVVLGELASVTKEYHNVHGMIFNQASLIAKFLRSPESSCRRAAACVIMELVMNDDYALQMSQKPQLLNSLAGLLAPSETDLVRGPAALSFLNISYACVKQPNVPITMVTSVPGLVEKLAVCLDSTKSELLTCILGALSNLASDAEIRSRLARSGSILTKLIRLSTHNDLCPCHMSLNLISSLAHGDAGNAKVLADNPLVAPIMMKNLGSPHAEIRSEALRAMANIAEQNESFCRKIVDTPDALELLVQLERQDPKESTHDDAHYLLGILSIIDPEVAARIQALSERA